MGHYQDSIDADRTERRDAARRRVVDKYGTKVADMVELLDNQKYAWGTVQLAQRLVDLEEKVERMSASGS